MFEILNSPSSGIPIMISAIALMNYYIRKYQLTLIREHYDKVMQEREMKTQKLAYELLADICTS